MAQEELWRARSFRGALEGEDGSDGGWGEIGILQGHIAIQRALLHGPDAELTPAGDSHGFHEITLGCGARLMLVQVTGEELAETVGALFF